MTRNTQIHTGVNVNFCTWSDPGVYFHVCKFTPVYIHIHMRTFTYVSKIYVHIYVKFVCKSVHVNCTLVKQLFHQTLLIYPLIVTGVQSNAPYTYLRFLLLYM